MQRNSPCYTRPVMWAFYAFAAAILVTAIPLLQERFRADGFALAFWVKVFVVLLTLPYAAYLGLPVEPRFYFWVALSAVLYSISDVIFFRAVPRVGSGVVTRVLPATVIITFLLWFAVDPSLIAQYAAQPAKSAAIIGVLALFVFFATRVKKCAVTWAGVRMIWFVIFAGCVGPVISKIAIGQMPAAYVAVQAFFMAVFLAGFYAFKRPIGTDVFLCRNSVVTGLLIGAVMALVSVLKAKALQLAENPAYVTVIFFTDAIWVLAVYKMIGRKESANVWAGLGIVASAAALVLVRSL